jgi:CubicO group peptidase (beta-lactamase class C family)
LGAVYLNGGLWKDQLIISKKWIEVSTKPFIHATPELEYGFQWWVYNFEFDSVPLKSFSARGWGGQNIIVFPDLDLVVITTAGYYDEPGLEYHINGLLIPAILSAVL